MKEFTNVYTQIKNNILLRNKYKIIVFSPSFVDLYLYNNKIQKIQINQTLNEEELDNLVDKLNQGDITCICGDNSNPEENC